MDIEYRGERGLRTMRGAGRRAAKLKLNIAVKLNIGSIRRSVALILQHTPYSWSGTDNGKTCLKSRGTDDRVQRSIEGKKTNNTNILKIDSKAFHEDTRTGLPGGPLLEYQQSYLPYSCDTR